MSNTSTSRGFADDFLEQILEFPAFAAGTTDHNLSGNYGSLAATAADNPMIFQLISAGDGSIHHHHLSGDGAGGFHFPLGLSLEHGTGRFLKIDDASESGGRSRGGVVDGRLSSSGSPVHRMPNAVRTTPHQPVVRPTRMRARRGQATDPHSIAERIRREKIAERSRALQELVPSINKTDRAVMVDEIMDYVKFLRLQVKVLKMSRLGGANVMAPLVTNIPTSCVEDEAGEGGRNQAPWEKWCNDDTEQHVAKLMEENVGAAMQFLQSKTLCIMPVSLASLIYHTQSPDLTLNPESSPLL